VVRLLWWRLSKITQKKKKYKKWNGKRQYMKVQMENENGKMVRKSGKFLTKDTK